jgi:1,4-alpha-glucan branching enzyme
MLKLMYTLLLSCATILVSNAQLLTWSPNFSNDNTNITITLDAAKGNAGLVGHTTSDVYIHTGVITSASTSNSDWKYVKTTWGTTTPAFNCSSLGNDKWYFSINNIRTYYGVPASETILKIAILFRSGDGNKVQRNTDGSDMYIPIYQNTGAPYAFITEPFRTPTFKTGIEPITKNVGDAMSVTAVSTNATNLVISFNGIDIATSNNFIATANTNITTAGQQRIIATATNGANVHRDTVDFFVAPNVTIAPLPNGVKDGINYINNTTVTLVLRAPGKNTVQVIGDFNNWTQTTSGFMNKTADGKYFWITLTGLTAGQQYGFQYLVDNTIKIGDPYAELVLDPFNDPYINEAAINPNTYPNLKPYPTGLTTGLVSVFQTNAPAYTFTATNYTRPNKKALVVYEVLLRDFIKNHDWKTLTDTLSYFKRLGVNAIQIMPFNEFDGNNSWGYNPSYFLAPDKYYGPKNALKTFIDSCHKNNIAVIMDIAMNHTTGDNPLAKLYWNSTTNKPAADNPWLNIDAKHPFNVFNDFNHESADTRYFTKRVIEHWLTEYKIDGFRWDLSKGFTQVQSNDVGAWNTYDQSRVNIWKDYYAHHQMIAAGSYCILEHLGDNTEERTLADEGMMLWGKGWDQYVNAAKGNNVNSNLTATVFHTDRSFTNQHIVGYMHSHDEERLINECLRNGNQSNVSQYNPRDTTTAIKRMEALAPFLIATPGPKMLWQFEELAYPFSINLCEDGTTINNDCRTAKKPIRWDYQNDARRTALYNVYAKMIDLRRRENNLYENLFINGAVSKNMSGDVKWMSVSNGDLRVVVLANFGVNTQNNSSITFPNGGTWYGYLGNETVEVGSTNSYSFNLQPGDYKVFTNKNLNPNIVTGIGNINNSLLQMKVNINPNPIINNNATITINMPVTANVHMSLVNVSGQTITTIFNGTKVKGIHIIPMQVNTTLAKGIYFVKTVVDGKVRLDKAVVY